MLVPEVTAVSTNVDVRAPAVSRRRALLRRWGVFLVGAAALTSGVGLTIAAGVGVGSWQVFETGLVAATGASLPVVLVTESVVVLLIGWIWLKQTPGPATVILALGGGPVIGAVVAALPTDPSTALAVTEFVVGAALIAFGVGFYIAPNLGSTAQDSLFVGLFRQYGWRPSVARYVTDGALVAGGWALGGQVGVGTVVLTLAVAPLMSGALGLGQRLAGTTSPPPAAAGIGTPTATGGV